VTYRSVDGQDNIEESRTVTFKIDRTAPQASCTVTPAKLWPPNHKLVAVSARVAVSDATSGAAGFSLTDVSSSEPDSGTGPEDVPGDISGWTSGAADTEGRLRAERAGDGRTYTLTYTGSDEAGNPTTCRATVVVTKRRE
jgi:YD repeat-containing protein